MCAAVSGLFSLLDFTLLSRAMEFQMEWMETPSYIVAYDFTIWHGMVWRSNWFGKVSSPVDRMGMERLEASGL